MPCGGCLRDVLHRLVFGAGVVLGNPDDSAGKHQANQYTKPDIHDRGIGGGKVCAGKHPTCQRIGDHQREHAGHDQALVQGIHDLATGGGFHESSTNNRCDD